MLWTFRYFLVCVSLTNLVTAENQCRTEINIRGMALKGFVLKRMTVAAPHICDIQCEREVTCQSVMHCSLFIMIRLHWPRNDANNGLRFATTDGEWLSFVSIRRLFLTLDADWSCFQTPRLLSLPSKDYTPIAWTIFWLGFHSLAAVLFVLVASLVE